MPGRARGRRPRAACSTPRLRKNGKFETFDAYFSRPFGLDPSKVAPAPPAQGLARDRRHRPRPRRPHGRRQAPPHLDFSIRPAGRGAPPIDPKPILDGWKLLEATAIYRASGRNVLYGKDAGGMSIGQILLLPKPLLEQPRALRRAHRDLRRRPRRHPLRPDRPARAGDARVPRRVRPRARPSPP